MSSSQTNLRGDQAVLADKPTNGAYIRVSFVSPPGSASLISSTGRRTISRSVCARSRPSRHAIVMKKARRQVDDSTNAIDVFGNSNISQEELLAAALGEGPASQNTADADVEAESKGGKKKKKLKKGTVVNDDDHAVDVFGNGDVSQEQLLADALGESSSSSNVEEHKGIKGKSDVRENGSAVDVFGGAGMSQEDLLANALGDDSPAHHTTKKKKKKGKKGVIQSEENAVDVFAGTDVSQESLLADALGNSNEDSTQDGKNEDETDFEDTDGVDNLAGSVNSHDHSQDISTGADEQADIGTKKKKKGKKGKGSAILVDESNAVDVFASTGSSQEEMLADVLGGANTDSSSSQRFKSEVQEDDDNTTLFTFDDPGLPAHPKSESLESTSSEETNEVSGYDYLEAVEGVDTNDQSTSETDETDFGEDASETEVDDSFEPDEEVVAEFEKSTEEFKIFTQTGRREQHRAKKKTRNEESALADAGRVNFGTGGEKYTSVRLEDVTMTFRDKPVLNGVTWGVQTGERVGLVGENGCGKTTQLRLIAGTLDPSSGEIVRSSSRTKSSFLRQEFVDELDPRRTLREEFTSAFTEESALLAAYEECEREVATAGDNMEMLEKLLNRLEDLRVKCDEKDAWNLDSRIDKVMPGLGFTEDDNDKLVASYSGGWKVRIGLGKILLQDPDLLLLDEPSNHLDNESVEWLEQFLQSCKLPMVVVSHDREFLDRVCTKIVEIEMGEAFEYPGNYTTFVKLKKEQRAAWEAAYERQQKFLKEQTDFIKQNRRSPARSSQAKSREKMIERMERTGQMVRRPPRQGKPLVFRFPPAPRSGRDCILVEDLTHGYGARILFEEASIGIERGDRVALIGPNGSGKSTLLRLITGREEPQEGTVECESLTNVSLAYYEQNQADALDLDITVVDTLMNAASSSMTYEEIRALLGKFLFKGDDVEKKVRALSGGEKARLALAKIMLKPSNVLIFDEPGNHLSISAKEMLEEALQHFDGTLLLVSHDRYLISQVATQIVAIEDKQLVLYDGDYKSYMEKNDALRAKLEARFIPGVSEIKNAPKIAIEEPVELVEKKTKRKKNFGGSGIQSGKTKEMNAKRWKK